MSSLPNNRVWDLAHVVSRFHKKRKIQLEMQRKRFQFENRDEAFKIYCWFGLAKKNSKVSEVLVWFNKPVRREQVENGIKKGLNKEFKEFIETKTKEKSE